MIFFYMALWTITLVSIFYVINIVFNTVKLNAEFVVIFLITLLGWVYWVMPSNFKLGDISNTNIYIREGRCGESLRGHEKKLMYELMKDADLKKILTRAGLEKLGNKEDTVISVDTDDIDFHIYLQEELTNYSYVSYNGNLYTLSNETKYYPIINRVLDCDENNQAEVDPIYLTGQLIDKDVKMILN